MADEVGPITPYFIVAQYEQTHKMRREYNRFLFQAPTIVIAVVGGSIAIFGKISAQFPRGFTLDVLAELSGALLFIAGFVFVMAMWAYRSRLLLRRLEHTLNRFEATYGVDQFVEYPFEVNKELLHWWQRAPSTLLIVIYLFLFSAMFAALALVGLAHQMGAL